MKLRLKNSPVLAILVLALSPLAHAQVTETATENSTARKILSNTTVSDYSMFFGPTVTDPTTATQVGKDAQNEGLSSRHFVSLNYQATPVLTISPVLDFNYQFTGATGRAERASSLNDVYLKVSRSSLLSRELGGGFAATLDSDARYYAPTSVTSHNEASAGSFRLSLNPSVQLGRSKFSITSENYARAWIQPSTGKDIRTFKLYTGPQLNYSVNRAITAFVLYEATVDYQTSVASGPSATPMTDLEPGVEFRVLDQLSLIPYINWYPAQSIRTASINLNADIRLF